MFFIFFYGINLVIVISTEPVGA